jgi:hypothetical protein
MSKNASATPAIEGSRADDVAFLLSQVREIAHRLGYELVPADRIKRLSLQFLVPPASLTPARRRQDIITEAALAIAAKLFEFDKLLIDETRGDVRCQFDVIVPRPKGGP